MTQRRKWTAIPGLLLLVIGAVVLSAYSGASSSQGNQPTQPINFPHPRHAGAVKDGGLGLNCLYCHNSGNKSADVGMPAVSTCMGCHTIVAAAKPEIQKLAKYDAAKKPVPWVRIHKVPDYVHFPHVRHVNAGVTCQTCHGQVQKMAQVYQYASLNMGWCVNCHVNGYDPKEGQRAARLSTTCLPRATRVAYRTARPARAPASRSLRRASAFAPIRRTPRRPQRPRPIRAR